MDYTIPKLHIPKDGKDWYVYYSCKHPETGEMIRCKERDGINRLKTKKEKIHKGAVMVTGATNKLKSGWTPWQKKEENPKFNTDFYWWFQERIEYSRVKHGFYNTQRLEDTLLRLKGYAPALKVSEVDLKFIQGFEQHLIKRGNIQNTIAERLIRVRLVVRELVGTGVIMYHKNPFLKYEIRRERTKKERFTINEINQLENTELTGLPDIARDMFLISFYCGGVRFGDLCRLKKEYFSEHLQYIMNKTKMNRNIKVMPQVQKIIDKYINSPSPYLFELSIDWNNEEKSIQRKDSEMLKHLKKACKEAGLKNITFHTSRNSLADHASNLGYDALTIRDLLGLKKVATAEIYLADSYKEKSDLAMDKLFK